MERIINRNTYDMIEFTLVVDPDNRINYQYPIIESINNKLVVDGESVVYRHDSWNFGNAYRNSGNPDYTDWFHHPVDGEIYNFTDDGIHSARIYNSETKRFMSVKGKIVKIHTTNDNRSWYDFVKKLDFSII